MEYVKVAGRTYSDPDIISLIRETGQLVDPRASVVTQARRLNEMLEQWNGGDDELLDPMKRLEILASLRGLTIAKMNVETQRQDSRDAILVPVGNARSSQILYNPARPKGRVAFSIAHEISHTFFPTSIHGARFRAICADESREANELERLCDLGAAEILMPLNKFQSAVGASMRLDAVDRLAERFGSSYEATVFRMATAFDGIAMAGLLRYRRRVGEERALRARSAQRNFFTKAEGNGSTDEPAKKYRRQSLHFSDSCRAEHLIPWNKSFDFASCVYIAGQDSRICRAQEELPNKSKQVGNIEAVRAPYQRENCDPDFEDVLFLWWA
jgi:Zn-dependent peptidase ImmA (M78 family)